MSEKRRERMSQDYYCQFLFGQCSNINGPNENKCYWNYTGSYVEDSKNVINDMKNNVSV